MKLYKKSMDIMNELFGRNYQFALATSYYDMPSVRFVDTFYYDESFYFVTDANSKKKGYEANPTHLYAIRNIDLVVVPII